MPEQDPILARLRSKPRSKIAQGMADAHEHGLMSWPEIAERWRAISGESITSSSCQAIARRALQKIRRALARGDG